MIINRMLPYPYFVKVPGAIFANWHNDIPTFRIQAAFIVENMKKLEAKELKL
jgi:hypothetical protein